MLLLYDLSLLRYFIPHVCHRRVYHLIDQLRLILMYHLLRMRTLIGPTAQPTISLLLPGCHFGELRVYGRRMAGYRLAALRIYLPLLIIF
jgi:hypothetical protein